MVFLKFLSRLPFPVLYFFSGISYFTLYRLIRYRRGTSFNNIKNSFPDKSKNEIITLQKQAYRNICDSFFELVKTYDIDEQEIHARVNIKNIESIKSVLSNNQSALLLTAHTGPTEWVAQALHLHLQYFIDPVYKPAHSAAIDNFIFAARSRFNSTPIPYKKLAKDIITRKNVNRCIAILADLSPRRREQTITLNFLNQPTRFFLSIERIAKLNDTPVFFIAMKRLTKGYYEATAYKLCDHPSQLNKDELTIQYAKHVEDLIKQNPADWLWTHRRWKHCEQIKNQPQSATG